MIRLTATLVAKTLMRPRRPGWSADRGVDFSLRKLTVAATIPSAGPDDRVSAEPASFIDTDEAVPLAATAVRPRPGPSLIDVGREPGSRESSEAPGLRAWWSMSGKASDT